MGATSKKAERARQRESPEDRWNRSGMRILVVEDEPAFAETLCGGIVDHDGSVVLRHVKNVEEAAGRLNHEHFDAVLLDLGLPDSDGVETIRRITMAEPRIAIVVLTSADEQAVARRAIEMGAQDFLEKTRADPASIVRSARYACTRARLHWQIRDLVHENPDAMLVVDARGVVRLANAAANALLSSGEQLEGRPSPLHLVSGGRGEMRFPADSDDARTLAVHATALRWEDDECVLASIRDITELRRSQALERRLQHAERLAAIGRLAASVAHEVNNPAAFIRANLETLQEELAETGARRAISELVEDCLSGIGRISRIVHELTGFARTTDDEVAPVDLCDVAQSACTMATSALSRQARVELDLEPTPPIVADSTKLVQVALNLIVNAAHAVEASRGRDGSIRVATRADADEVVLVVEDNGPGIPEELRKRIFEPFFTTKPTGKGTGLGLAIAADTVHSHGGRLLVDSTLGVGSRFEMRLPRRTHFDRAIHRSGTRTRIDPARRLRVLIVDDEEMLRRAFERRIGQTHETMSTDGPGALQVLRVDPHFDVIVCDLMMPRVDGPALYAWVLEDAPHLAERFVFLTGGAITDRARTFLEDNEVRVLRKPLEGEELLRVIDEVG